MILRMAFLNLFRHRTRSLLSLLTISGAIASILIFRGHAQHILETVRTYSAENQYGHLQIGNQNLWSSRTMKIKDQLFEPSEQLLNKLKQVPGLVTASPRLSLQGLLNYSDNQMGAKLVGYSPDTETQFRDNLKIVEGSHLEDPNAQEIILGSGLQASLKVKPGDSISIVTQTVDGVVNALDLTVKGAFQSTIAEVDNQVAFVPIKVAQTLLDTTQIEVLVLRLNNLDDSFKVRDLLKNDVQALQPGVVVKTWRDLADLYNRTEEFFKIQNGIIQGILSTLTILAILNTVGMTVYERTGEIGTLRSLGLRRSEVIAQFLLEGLYLAFIGGILGSGLGVLSIFLINISGFKTAIPGASVDIAVQADYVPAAFVMAVILGILATLVGTIIPAWRASKISIVEALRRNI